MSNVPLHEPLGMNQEESHSETAFGLREQMMGQDRDSQVIDDIISQAVRFLSD